MPNIVVPLPKATSEKLIEDALRDCRDPKSHAVYLIEVALGMRKDNREKIPEFIEPEKITGRG